MAGNRKKNRRLDRTVSLRFTRTELLGWAGVLLVAFLWFFVLGVLVGRGLVPLEGMEAAVQKESAAQATSIPEKKQADAVVSEKKPGSSTQKGGVGGLSANSPVSGSVSQDPLPAAHPAEPPQEPQPIKAGSGQPGQEVSTPAVVDDPSGAEKIFTIQVAAVRGPEDARKMVEKLRKKGFKAYTTTVRLSDGITWYRIRCGEFESRKEAEPVIKGLEKEGYGPILVRR